MGASPDCVAEDCGSCDEERGGSKAEECKPPEEERGGSKAEECEPPEEERGSREDELRGPKKELEFGDSIADEDSSPAEESGADPEDCSPAEQEEYGRAASDESVPADSSSEIIVPSADDVDSPLQPNRASAANAPAETKPIVPLRYSMPKIYTKSFAKPTPQAVKKGK